MAASKFTVNFTILQGATLREVWLYKAGATVATVAPVDMTGWTGRLHTEGSVLTLTTEDGGLTLTADGEVKLYLSAAATTALDFDQVLFHIELTIPGGDVLRKFEGMITLDRELKA